MYFDGSHFSFSAICTCFLKNKNNRARKGYKNLSVSLPTNAVALTLENIKESTKKKNVLILGFEPGTLRLQYWTGQLSDHHDYGFWLVPCFESLGIYYQECRILKRGTSNPGCATCFKYTASNQLVTNTVQLEFLLRFLNLNFGNTMKLHFHVWDIWCKYTLERLPCW